jgi:BirA family transcriptional regulator, biotin operon repressor / biotin---[acetyl-CoA-carboxylase] ligase
MSALEEGQAGFRLALHDELDSTNLEARRQAGAGEASGLAIQARRQTAGRGRRGRAWVSDSGNLYLTLLLRPAVSLQQAATLSFVTALAAADAVEAALPPTAPRPGLKWPNDVMIDGRKLTGILLESDVGTDGLAEWVAVGIGINVAHHPEAVERPATSLAAQGSVADADRVRDLFLAAFAAAYADWLAGGFPAIRGRWLERAVGRGEPVEVRLEQEQFAGIFSGLSADGALLVSTAAGERSVSAGDVFFPQMAIKSL